MFLETKAKFDEIFQNRLEADQIREYFLELYNRGETASEFAGAASSMRDYVIPLPIDEELRKKSIDIVGTGGDKSYSFNISTTVSIHLASAGCYVAKHGNRSVTSKSGSADMLETARFPCLATMHPRELKTKDVVLEILKLPLLSPPVPTISIRRSRKDLSKDSFMECSRITLAAAARSTSLSPLS